jgi:hypothetical protein
VTNRRIRRPGHHQSREEHQAPLGGRVRDFPLRSGLPDVEVLSDELEEYRDVLMGRTPPPIDAGHLTLMEVADAYFARASEIQMMIMKAEREGGAFKGSSYYKFRTGELRTFLEMTKRASDLGSRRLTQARMLHEMAHDSQGLAFFEDSD